MALAELLPTQESEIQSRQKARMLRKLLSPSALQEETSVRSPALLCFTFEPFVISGGVEQGNPRLCPASSAILDIVSPLILVDAITLSCYVHTGTRCLQLHTAFFLVQFS